MDQSERMFKMAESNDLFSRILSRGPSRGTLLVILEKMKDEGRLQDVVQQGITALKQYPDDLRLRCLLAEAYMELGLLGQAETELLWIASELKELSCALKLQGQVYLRQSRTQEAADSLKIYLAHNPGDSDAIDLLGPLESKCEEGEDFSPPEESFHEEADGLLSGLATPTLAEIYLTQGQTVEAIETYEKVLTKHPEDAISRDRLREIKRSVFPEIPPPSPKSKLNGQTEKMISVLEGWLLRIQELNRVG
jgi:tetratricopeptide (TPR) repeat protein